MSQWSLSQTFLMLCCAVSVAAVVVGHIVSPSVEDSGWLGVAAFGALFAGLAMMSRRHHD